MTAFDDRVAEMERANVGHDAAARYVRQRYPERTVALRKLLESKDAAVRAALATPLSPSR